MHISVQQVPDTSRATNCCSQTVALAGLRSGVCCGRVTATPTDSSGEYSFYLHSVLYCSKHKQGIETRLPSGTRQCFHRKGPEERTFVRDTREDVTCMLYVCRKVQYPDC